MHLSLYNYIKEIGIVSLSEYIIFISITGTLLFVVLHQLHTSNKTKVQQQIKKINYGNPSSITALAFILISPLMTFELGFIYGYDSNIFYYWILFFISLLVFFDVLYWERVKYVMVKMNKWFRKMTKYYMVHEVSTSEIGELPQPPTDEEKYVYVKRNNMIMLLFSIVSFSAIQISMFNFLSTNELLWPIFFYFILTIIYFLVSFIINISSKDFDVKAHKKTIKKWKSSLTDSVDIFLPTAGEPIEVLKNTWDGIREVKRFYRGNITVYCLDDADRSEVKRLAQIYDFKYEVRANRGWFKKAGNLRHGFTISKSTFIAIFDADFRPREDILQEMLPYFYENTKVGLVQSPQYFDVQSSQNWLQRGAGAVQELFYRVSQVSRQNHDASICVGSNAMYRRAALNDTGGTALIEHSEDVHTGFNMRMHGWTIQYLPIVLAKGLCPGDMKAFFKQQYRWCLGSMSLFSSKKFWQAKISVRARLSYFSGFLYYIHTAASSFFVPIIPLAILILYPEQVTLQNYLLILPSIIFVQVIYPLWHKATYGIEAWSTRTVYGWAHMFAITDAITRRTMQWQATGTKIGKDLRYVNFRILQIIFNFIPSIIWIYLSAEKVFVNGDIVFLPILLSGIYYYLITSKVTFYIPNPSLSINKLKQEYFWRVIPAGSFSFTSFLLIVGLTTVIYASSANDGQYISPIAPIKNANSASQDVEVKGTSHKIIRIEKGAYIETATANDSLENMIQRMLNTYSAESGDILTLRQRNIVGSRIFERFSDKQLIEGDEINISREVMRMYVQESKRESLIYK